MAIASTSKKEERVNKAVAKLPKFAPFGYAEPLPRLNLKLIQYQGHFTLNLGVFSPFRAALRCAFSALSSFAES